MEGEGISERIIARAGVDIDDAMRIRNRNIAQQYSECDRQSRPRSDNMRNLLSGHPFRLAGCVFMAPSAQRAEDRRRQPDGSLPGANSGRSGRVGSCRRANPLISLSGGTLEARVRPDG